jgi:hypothetical protein
MPNERITVSVNEFLEMSGMKRTSLYRLIKEGRLRSVLVCGRRLVVVASYLEMIGEQPTPHAFSHPSEPSLDEQPRTERDIKGAQPIGAERFMRRQRTVANRH